MKKLLTFLFCTALLVSVAAFWTGCDSHTHSYTPEEISATCTEQGYTVYTCSCGDSYTDNIVPALGHDIISHNANTDKLCTEVGWYAYDTCSRCSYSTYQEIAPTQHEIISHLGQEPTCTADGWNAYDTCKNCSYTTYSSIPSEGHDKVYHEGKDATCTEAGWYAYETCNNCDYNTKEAIEPLDHLLQHHEACEPTCTSKGNEAYDSCLRQGCGYSTYVELPEAPHDLEYYEEKEANCYETGWKAYEKCKDCSYTTFEATPYKHQLTYYDAVEPTCETSGYYAYEECSLCSHTTYTPIPDLGHDIHSFDAKEPTCLNVGWHAYEKCMREGCNNSTYSEIAALGHDITTYNAQPATCTEAGHNAYETCSRCSHNTFEEIPALKHQISNFEGQEPTCLDFGWHAYEKCTRTGCGHTTYSQIAALGHDLTNHAAQAATCTAVGWHAYEECGREGCGHTTYSEIAALGHSYSQKITQPTCTEQGYTTHTCGNCGDNFNDTFVAAKGHQPSGNVSFNATQHSYTCVCGEELSSTHSFTNKLCSCGAHESIKYLTFTAITGGYAVSGCQDVAAEIVIPTYYMGQPVLEIGRAAFKEHTLITKVKFEQNSMVKVFNELAFYDCTAVVEIPSKIEQIYADAYEFDYSLNNGIKTDYEGCTYLGNAYNPYVFLLGGYESTVKVHAQTRIINSYAFYPYDATRLTQITFESNDNLVWIGENAFWNTYIEEVTIPSSVKYLGARAFAECNNLKTVNFSSANTNLTVMPERAFYKCPELMVVNIANGVTDIGNEVFERCEKLALVNIPASVINMGNNVFRYCKSSILNICCMANDDNWASSWANPTSAFYDCVGVFIDGSIYLISDGKATLAKWGGENQVVIPEKVSYAGVEYKVVAIKEGLFTNNTSITSLSIPSGIKEIGTYTFSCCSNLKTITFAENSELETIKSGAFDYTAIEVLHLPNGLTTIEAGAFSYCNLLKEIYIPLSVSVIEAGAFDHYGEQTVLVFCQAASKPEGWQTLTFGYYCSICWDCIGSTTFDDITYALHSNNTAAVIKFDGTAELLVIPETITYNEQTYSVTSITVHSFSGEINNLIIPASVVKIEEYAFSYLTLNRILFCGTEEQWNNPDNLSFWDAYIYSENTPEESGYFWHYDTDGKTPIIY